MGHALACCILLVACGRGGFEPIGDDGGATGDGLADAMTDGIVDALPDASGASVTQTFGVRSGVDVVAATVDTFISDETGEPTLNYGGSEELRSEADVSERILIRFDLASIPTSAVVSAASITVRIIQFDAAGTLTARPLLESWTEGTGDGSAGAANFTQRMTGTAWGTAGAGSPLSSGAVIGTATPTALADLTMTIDPASVQTWVTTPAQNFGLIFFNSFTESIRIASTEDPTASARPMMTVTYVP